MMNHVRISRKSLANSPSAWMYHENDRVRVRTCASRFLVYGNARVFSNTVFSQSSVSFKPRSKIEDPPWFILVVGLFFRLNSSILDPRSSIFGPRFSILRHSISPHSTRSYSRDGFVDNFVSHFFPRFRTRNDRNWLLQRGAKKETWTRCLMSVGIVHVC